MRDGNEVPRDDVAGMFDDIAPVYDRLNTIMTFGLDNGWRRAAVEQTGVEPGASCRHRVQDRQAHGQARRAGRTVRQGDRGRPVRRHAGARRGGIPRPGAGRVRRATLALPIDDDGVDAATIGFGMRNLSNFGRASASWHGSSGQVVAWSASS